MSVNKNIFIARPSRTLTEGVSIPWTVSTKNHDEVNTTYERIESGEGPDGTYFKFNADDTYDKNVWVIEGNEPVVPADPFTTNDAAEESKDKLMIQFTTNTGEIIHGWDAYDSGIVLAETTTEYLLSTEFDGFKWLQWAAKSGKSTSDAFQKRYGEGANNSQPIGVSGQPVFLNYRLNSTGQRNLDEKTNPWLSIKDEGRLNVSDFPERLIPSYKKDIESAAGKRFFRIRKSYVKDAVKKGEDTGGYANTESNPPTKVLEITWMAPQPKVSVKLPAVSAATAPNASVSLVGGNVPMQGLLDQPQYSKYVTYTQNDTVVINMAGLIDLVGYPPQTNRSPSFRGGSWRNDYQPKGRYKIRGGSEKNIGSSQFAPKVFTIENRKYDQYGIKFEPSSPYAQGIPRPVSGGVPLDHGYNQIRRDPHLNQIIAGGGNFGTPMVTKNWQPQRGGNYAVNVRSDMYVKAPNISTSVGSIEIPLDLFRDTPKKKTLNNVQITELRLAIKFISIMA